MFVSSGGPTPLKKDSSLADDVLAGRLALILLESFKN